MRSKTQEEQIQGMLDRPIPKKKVGIVHLEMVKESRSLYGMKRIDSPKAAAEMVRPLFERADREMTRRMEECGRILDLPLVDHIILGSQGWFMSFAELGLLENRFEIA